METIKTLLDQNYTPPLIAVFLDTTVERVVETMQKFALVGWGDPQLYAYIVARRLPGVARWGDMDAAMLGRCRLKHDAGELSMAQKKDQDHLIQYAFPLAEKVERRLWFTAPPETY